MPTPAEFPFEGFNFYGPVLDRKDNRYKVFLVKSDYSERKSLALARYRMCVHLGRILERWEEVDHIDDDCQNDILENLQVLSRKENLRKSNHSRGAQHVRLKCPGCGIVFHKSKRNTHLKRKNGAFTTCGRQCSGRARAWIQHGQLDKLACPISENVIEEFRYFIPEDS